MKLKLLSVDDGPITLMGLRPRQIWYSSGHATLRTIWKLGDPLKIGRAKSTDHYNSAGHCRGMPKFGPIWVRVGVRWLFSAKCHLSSCCVYNIPSRKSPSYQKTQRYNAKPLTKNSTDVWWAP